MMKSKIVLKNLVSVSALLAALSSTSALATPMFEQGFETDTSGWIADGNYGNIAIQASGTNGINAFEGNFYGQFTQGNSAGAFTRFDGYRDNFPGDYFGQAAIYLDTSWALGSGFQYSVASNGSDGSHQRDFIFHVTKDTSTGSLLVGGSNNATSVSREDLETINNIEITESGWYIFEHLFRDDGGVLAVDLNLRDALGGLLFTETRSDASDLIPTEVGGNRYGWFTNIDVAGGIAVDATLLDLRTQVPEPTSIALLGLGVLGLAGMRKRKA